MKESKYTEKKSRIKIKSEKRLKRARKLTKRLAILILLCMIPIGLFIGIRYEVHAFFVKSDGNSSSKTGPNGESAKEKGDITKPIETDETKEDLLLVNKEHGLPVNYRPSDLREPDIPFNQPENSEARLLRDEAATMVEKMFRAAKKDGITLVGISGFRSYAYQERVYNKEVYNQGEAYANRYVAKPGYSEHNTGLVLDLLSTEYGTLDAGFENTKAFEWLENNASKYGFILRYPKDKIDIVGYSYEPWHYRYVGIKAAEEITKTNSTLEEYMGA